jgi:hypothetical protein
MTARATIALPHFCAAQKFLADVVKICHKPLKSSPWSHAHA